LQNGAALGAFTVPLNRTRARSRYRSRSLIVDREGGDNEHENEDEGETPCAKKIGGESNLLLFQQTTELNVVRSTSWRRFSSPAKQPF
jgi:hypothetical protein